MRVEISREAKRDIQEAYNYIAQDSPDAADRMLARIHEAADRLASGSIEGREVRLRDGRVVRARPVPPYRIYYRRTSQTLRIIRVYHQARRSIER